MIPMISPGLVQFRKGFYVGLYPGGLYIGGTYKLNTKNVSKQADNKSYFISLQDQIRNPAFKCNRKTKGQILIGGLSNKLL